MKKEREMEEGWEGGVQRSKEEKKRLAEIQRQAREFMDSESKVGRFQWEKRKTADEIESDYDDDDDDDDNIEDEDEIEEYNDDESEDDGGGGDESEDYYKERARKAKKGGKKRERQIEAVEISDDSDQSIVIPRRRRQHRRRPRVTLGKRKIKYQKRVKRSAAKRKRTSRRRVESSESDDSNVDRLSYLEGPAVRNYVKRRPIVLQISGPRVQSDGKIDMSTLPLNYTEAEKLKVFINAMEPPAIPSIFKKALKSTSNVTPGVRGRFSDTKTINIDDSADDDQQKAGPSGGGGRNGPGGRESTTGTGAEYNIEDQRMRILNDRISTNPLIGERSWVGWSRIWTFFACIATFLLNRRNEDNIVYKKVTTVKKEAKQLLRDAKRLNLPLKTRRKLNLKVVPDLSDYYEIIINVWSTKKRKLLNDNRNIDVFDFQRPQLEILRTESGRFCLITKLGRFLARQVCADCSRKFNNRQALYTHKTKARCPYQRFMERFPDGTREDFFETPYEEFMIEKTFPRGKIRPCQSIEERLQVMYINMPLNFHLKRYFCVSDIESFLRPLPHKSIDGEEEDIRGDLQGLIFTDVHQPADISAISNLGGDYSVSQCFINMDGSSSFIENFCRYLYKMADYQHTLLKHEHEIIIEQLEWKERQLEEQGADEWFLRKIRKLRKDIEIDGKKLVVYFFNASYDLNCLIRHGLCWYLEMLDTEEAEKAANERREQLEQEEELQHQQEAAEREGVEENDENLPEEQEQRRRRK